MHFCSILLKVSSEEWNWILTKDQCEQRNALLNRRKRNASSIQEQVNMDVDSLGPSGPISGDESDPGPTKRIKTVPSSPSPNQTFAKNEQPSPVKPTNFTKFENIGECKLICQIFNVLCIFC